MAALENKGVSRRDFLTGAAALAGGLAAASAIPAAAHAEEAGVIGDWAADGSKAVAVAPSKDTNASASDGTYREHDAAAFPANDATAIEPRKVPDAWDYECDVVVVGAGGGGLNAAARAAELGASVICVESMASWGGNAQSAGMCGILGGYSKQEEKRFAFPSYPFDPKALTDWAMDEYHYAADPKLIYKIACEGGHSLDWMADCGVKWRLGEVPVYVAPKNSTLDHHVLKMKDATDAMYDYGVSKGVEFIFRCPAEALVQDETGRIVAWSPSKISSTRFISARLRASFLPRAASATTKPCSIATFPRRPWAARRAILSAAKRASASAWAWALAPMCRASTAPRVSMAASIGRLKAGNGRASSMTA